RVRAVEIRLAGEDAGEQQRRVDRRELDLLEPLSRVHVEEVIAEAVVAGRAGRRGVLGRGPEEAQRLDNALPGLVARDVGALHAGRVGGEGEGDRRDT